MCFWYGPSPVLSSFLPSLFLSSFFIQFFFFLEQISEKGTKGSWLQWGVPYLDVHGGENPDNTGMTIYDQYRVIPEHNGMQCTIAYGP
jgi:hypothetical protein